METKCTKGEWSKQYISGVCTGIGASTKLENGTYTEMICNTILPENDDDYAKIKDQIEADMSMMAASKDLYQALVELNSIMDLSQVESLKKIQDKAKEAIKKATS